MYPRGWISPPRCTERQPFHGRGEFITTLQFCWRFGRLRVLSFACWLVGPSVGGARNGQGKEATTRDILYAGLGGGRLPCAAAPNTLLQRYCCCCFRASCRALKEAGRRTSARAETFRLQCHFFRKLLHRYESFFSRLTVKLVNGKGTNKHRTPAIRSFRINVNS